MAEYRALGVPAKFDSATNLEIGLVRVDDGSSTVDLTAATTALPTFAAGSVYRFPDLCQAVVSKLQTWIFDALTAHASITVNPSAAADIDVNLSWPSTPSTSANGNLLTLTIGPDLGGAETSGGPVVLSRVQIGNTTSAPWHLLGLIYEADDTRLENASNDVCTFSGLFQSRLIYVVERSEQDFGDEEEPAVSHAHLLADGSTAYYEVGIDRHTRTLRLQDLDEEIAGRPQVIGRVSSTSAATITISNPTTSGLLTNISSPYVNTSRATVGRYVHVPGGWVARERSDSATSIVLAEEIPSGVTVPAGAPVTMISELQALFFEARRTGMLVVYDVNDDDGAILWTSQEYTLLEPRYAPERHSPGAALYSVEWRLLRKDKPGLTTV